MQQTNDIVGQ